MFRGNFQSAKYEKCQIRNLECGFSRAGTNEHAGPIQLLPKIKGQGSSCLIPLKLQTQTSPIFLLPQGLVDPGTGEEEEAAAAEEEVSYTFTPRTEFPGIGHPKPPPANKPSS